jgi:hypothetical protein
MAMLTMRRSMLSSQTCAMRCACAESGAKAVAAFTKAANHLSHSIAQP